ncbi:MAG: hypothetical protein J6K61_00670 [Clostridia bacterium]|nr:hypothetical protein [Clostridia bacterium]
MSAIAELCLDLGFSVFGSDRAENQATRRLSQKGIYIEIGEEGKKITEADLLVYTLAVPLAHPLLQKAMEAGIEAVPRNRFLGEISRRFPVCACVAGMHGKSSTVGMCAEILRHTSLSPTVLSGAPFSKEEGCYRKGSGEILLMEACEYKAAFLSFAPTHIAILNIEWEHTDYYPDLQSVLSAFQSFVRKRTVKRLILPREKAPLCERKGVLVKTFGYKGDFYAVGKKERGGFWSFSLYEGALCIGQVHLQTPGEYQIENALAAAALCESLGVPKQAILKGLCSYKGIPRRMEYMGRLQNAPVYLDYAHHPSELSSVLQTARLMGKTVVVFQPHTYSRLAAFHTDLASLLRETETCGVLPVYAAREAKAELDSEMLAKEAAALFLPDFESAAAFLQEQDKEENVLLVIGAGDVENIFPYLNIVEKP